jgi:hypothetical protein
MKRRPPVHAHIAVLILMPTLAGCDDSDRVSVYPVSGKVLHRGRPAAGANVIFHATDPSAAASSVPIPRGTVQADGTFELSSYEESDGAPAGTYDVTVIWPPDAADPNADPESAGGEADRLRGRYANPNTSGLSATVLEAETQLEPFELQ